MPEPWRSQTSHRMAVDTRTGAIGYLLSRRTNACCLEPLEGGAAWSAPLECVRAATPAEVAAVFSGGIGRPDPTTP